jgi:hypothetical protein
MPAATAVIDRLAERTLDAYSADRYRSWRACAAILLRRGMTEREAEAVLRSKHMRWAADEASISSRRVSSAALERYLAKYPISKKELASLVAGTFSD